MLCEQASADQEGGADPACGMPERAGQTVAQQQAKQRHPGLKQTEHYSDAQPGPGIDATDADRDGRGEVGQAQASRAASLRMPRNTSARALAADDLHRSHPSTAHRTRYQPQAGSLACSTSFSRTSNRRAIEGQLVGLSASSLRPERRSDDGQMILKVP